MEKLAIVSVYDKTNLVPFVQTLVETGHTILSTGGTATALSEAGIKVTQISDYTGHPEILDGRVKTLHPKVHAGILARRDNPNDLEQLVAAESSPVDFVVVNLYPFVDKVREIEASGAASHGSLIEYIDIGGPTMLRAAAKNCQHVIPVSDPRDYDRIAKELKDTGGVSIDTRRKMAARVFTTMSSYDGAIAKYFSLGEELLEGKGKLKHLAPVEPIVLERVSALRYGENPHQQGALYRRVQVGGFERTEPWTKLQGKELSYNNLLDMQGTLGLYLELANGNPDKHVAAIIKHSNPCGAAVRETALSAFVEARSCDPVSAFGGIIAVSGEVDAELANSILEGFVEVVLARDYSDEAREVFSKKKNVRVLKCDFDLLQEQAIKDPLLVRNFCGDYLVQENDAQLSAPDAIRTATSMPVTDEQYRNLYFAWQICKHVKSNTIVIANDMKAIGVGAGQMSRVDAAKIAVQRAREHGHSLEGSVAASDAFLPFSDALEVLKDAGIKALVQPGGSIKDEDVIKSAEEWGVAMVFSGERHFRH